LRIGRARNWNWGGHYDAQTAANRGRRLTAGVKVLVRKVGSPYPPAKGFRGKLLQDMKKLRRR